MTEVSSEYISSINNSTAESTGVDRFSPLFVEYRLMKEFVLFQRQTIQNIYLVPSYESPFKWFGVLFIHEGLYQGAVLRFTFNIPPNYPEGFEDAQGNLNIYPWITFDNPPFHPLVDPEKGKFNSTHLIPQWNPRVHQFWMLFVHLKNVFINVEKELHYDVNENSSIPEDIHYFQVVTMYRDNQELFVNKIAQTVESSKSLIYQPPKDKDDPNAIVFTEVDPGTLERWKNNMLNFRSFKDEPLMVTTPTISSQLENNRSYNSLSWVQNDIPFSRPIL